MKSNISRIPVLLTAIMSLASSASAQSNPAEVSMKVDLVAWGESISGLSLKSGNAKNPVTALAFRYSTPLTYSGPDLMEIHRTADAPIPPVTANATDKPSPTPPSEIATLLTERRKKDPTLVSLAILPASSKRVTVLLAPASAGTYQSYVIDDDPARLPPGKLRIHNLSPFQIAMRCNDKISTKLKPKDTMIAEAPNHEVIYELSYQKNNEWVAQENNIATVKADEQTQMVVLKSDASYFASQDGSRSGFLQTVLLRRSAREAGIIPELSPEEKVSIIERQKRQEDQMRKRVSRRASKPNATKTTAEKTVR